MTDDLLKAAAQWSDDDSYLKSYANNLICIHTPTQSSAP